MQHRSHSELFDRVLCFTSLVFRKHASFMKPFFPFSVFISVMQLLLSISFSGLVSWLEVSSLCCSVMIGASSFTAAMIFSKITKNRKADNIHRPGGVDA